jgi:signal transduction histidine kinase/CheY-like chemotaxis protein
MLLRRFSILILLMLAAASFAEQKRVLVLNAYHEGFYWTDRIMIGVKSVLNKEPEVELFVNYMDMKRYFDKSYYTTLRNLFAHKYANMDFDVILASDDHALDFLLQYRDELFPGTPVVFCGINDFKPERIKGHSGYTGICESYDIAGTVNMMKGLHPEATTINFVIDDTLTGHYYRGLIERVEPSFAGRLTFNYLFDLDVNALKQRLQALSDNDLVVWASYLRTPDGKAISCEDSLRLVSGNTSRPMYTIWDVVGQGGVVGGMVTSPIHQGQFIARQALKILQGESVDTLPVVDSPMVYCFDHQMLRKFGITDKQLPPGSILINPPRSLYAEYKVIIWLTCGFVVVLCLIIAALSRDILRRKKAEEALLESEAKLRHTEKMGALGQLAGGIAHDFNNQLSGVVGYADLLLEELEDADHRSFVDGIKKSALRSADLTAQLLAFSRRGKFLSVAVNMHDLIENVVTMLSHSIDKRIQLMTILKAEHYHVKGDPNQLQNAFLNVALNARDAMPAGGTLSFISECIELDKKITDAHSYHIPAGPYLSIYIKDTGCGMSQEIRDHIFEPFFTTKPVGQGTGMGLASTYGTIKSHQGFISVQSESDAGTIVTIYLPLTAKQAPPAPQPLRKDNLKKLGRILLIDDEPIIQKTTTHTLERMGYKVEVCCNGRVGVDFFKKDPDQIDLVLLDMMMPEMNGQQTYAALKQIKPNVKVIITSGYNVEGEVRDLLDQGALDYIAKPYSKDQLAAVLDKALQLEAY